MISFSHLCTVFCMLFIFSPSPHHWFLIELLLLNRWRVSTPLSKSDWMGSAESWCSHLGRGHINWKVLQLRGGHIREQKIIRNPPLLFTFQYSIPVSYLFYLFVSEKEAWAEYQLASYAFLFYCALLSLRTPAQGHVANPGMPLLLFHSLSAHLTCYRMHLGECCKIWECHKIEGRTRMMAFDI